MYHRHALRSRTMPVMFALMAGFALPALGGERRHSSDESLFSASEYMAHVERLASEEFEGRGTGQPGIDLAAEYIAEHFKGLGVAPAGDDGTYFQNFTLQLERELGKGTRLAVATDDGDDEGREAKLKHDYIPFSFSSSGSFDGELVFAGYGIVNEDENWNDYDGLDVEGKVLLVIRRAPAFGNFSVARDQTFMAKAAHAKERKAAAILIVNNSADEGLYPFEGQGRVRSYDIPMVHITRELADRLLKAGGLDGLGAAQKKIETSKKPVSAALSGVRVSGEVEISPKDTACRNVVGLIRGSGPQKDEIIVLGGHYDHLGIRKKGEPDFDAAKDISNGADDNASGTSLVMQLARAYTQGKAPNRSMLLVLFSAEEIGLLGSGYFTSHPTVDLENCVAMLNFDMVGRMKDNRLEVGGMRTGGFESAVRELAEAYELDIKDGGGGRGPSDHTHFYNKDIPVLFFFTGIHRQYHRPEDDVHLINTDGAIRIARFAADIIDHIDASAERPVFVADSRRAQISRQPEGDQPPAGPSPQAAAPTGVRLGVMTGDSDEPGVVVSEVLPDSPAAKAGLKPGDRIVRINRTRINSVEEAAAALAKLSEGDSANLGIFREGERVRVRVQFGEPRRRGGREAPQARQRREQTPRAGRAERDPQPGPRREARRPAAELSEAVRQFLAEVSEAEPIKSHVAGSTVSVDGNGGEITLHIRGEALVHSIDQIAHAVGGKFASFAEVRPRLIGRYRIEMRAVYESGSPVQSFHFTIDFDAPSRNQRGNREPGRSAANAAAAEGRDPHAAAHAGDAAHGQVDDRSETREMPPVRLGIMPTYGEGEGEGYEIAGVVENGAAAKAGMKDGDRILSIGERKISNVYEYMEALRKYKPGDQVPVTVLRDGKRVELKIKADGPMVREAA